MRTARPIFMCATFLVGLMSTGCGPDEGHANKSFDDRVSTRDQDSTNESGTVHEMMREPCSEYQVFLATVDCRGKHGLDSSITSCSYDATTGYIYYTYHVTAD